MIYRHCHYAHHLARPEDGNIIGVWISELLESNIDEIEKKVEHKNIAEIETGMEKLNDGDLIISGNISAAETPNFSRGVSSLSGGDSIIPGDDAESVEKENGNRNGNRKRIADEKSSNEGVCIDDITVLAVDTVDAGIPSQEQSDIAAATLARKEKFESSGMFRFIYDGPEGSGDQEAGSSHGVNKTEVKSTTCNLCKTFDDGTEKKKEKGKSSCTIS